VNDLGDRITRQAATTGQLDLTADEAAELADFVACHPHAAIVLGPGQLVALSAIRINVLPEI